MWELWNMGTLESWNVGTHFMNSRHKKATIMIWVIHEVYGNNISALVLGHKMINYEYFA
jgi:hypothetical protein